MCYSENGIASGLNCGVYRRVPARDRSGSFYFWNNNPEEISPGVHRG